MYEKLLGEFWFISCYKFTKLINCFGTTFIYKILIGCYLTFDIGKLKMKHKFHTDS